MVFRITNALTADDYRKIAKLLLGKKRGGEDADEDEEDDDLGVLIHGEDARYIKILDQSELELPLATINGRFHDGQIFSADSKTYSLEMWIEYESRENNFAEAVKVIKERGLPQYTVTTGKKTADFCKDGNVYRASCIGRQISISRLRDRKISSKALKEDIESIFPITECVVNTIYEVDKGDIELELRAKLRHSQRRVRSIRSRRKPLKNAIAIERPSTTFADIGGCEEAKAELTLLGYGLQKPEAFHKWGINYPKGVLLHGLPGTGKTLLARAMANVAKASLYCVSITDVLTCYYGESPKMVGRVFDIAEKHAPSIILFDEIDSLAQQREGAHEESGRVVSVLLQRMDGIKKMKNVTVIGTTNFMNSIDPALLRPGRFDKIIEVPLPDRKAREDIFRLHARGRRVAEDVDYALLAEKSDGSTGADIESFMQSALEKKLREELRTGNENLLPLNSDDILGCISEQKKRKESRQPGAMPRENSMMYA
jgi:transitional endoplasmic reticulum ATPase